MQLQTSNYSCPATMCSRFIPFEGFSVSVMLMRNHRLHKETTRESLKYSKVVINWSYRTPKKRFRSLCVRTMNEWALQCTLITQRSSKSTIKNQYNLFSKRHANKSNTSGHLLICYQLHISCLKFIFHVLELS